MRLVMGSDLHGQLPPVPQCDILVLAGDILPDNHQAAFMERNLGPWLNRAPAGAIVATWGNHDWLPFLRNFDLPWILLVDKSATVKGLKFFGSPWCLPIGIWAWQAPEHLLECVYKLIPEDVDILISHAPPYGMCDLAMDGDHCGSRALVKRTGSLKNLKFLVCGHIHEGRGKEGRVVNVACLDEKYRLRRDPWVVIDI